MGDNPIKEKEVTKTVTKPRSRRKMTPDQARISKINKETRVKVYGNPMFVPSLGEVYTFLYNGNPVSIEFNGEYQEYPETIAKLLEKKLAATARANTSKNVNTQIN